MRGQAFNRLRLQVTPSEKQTLLQLSSPGTTGDIKIPMEKGARVNANFKKVKLRKVKVAKKNKLKPSDIPRLSFTSQNLTYAGKTFDNVQLELEPNHDTLFIKRLAIDTDAYSLGLSGKWIAKGQDNDSSIKGELELFNTGRALSQWSFPSAIEGKGGKIDFALQWPGKPQDFNVKIASGDVQLNLNEGRIPKLSEEAEAKLGLGKLVNILSLQTLPRRLRLDFSDLTKSGFSFDVLEGHFKLGKGDTITDDLFLDGPVAKITMKGHINMLKRNYDLKLKVMPYLTSSLPIVATIAGGPIAGVVTWAADRVIRKEVAKMTAVHYTVTGPWEKPVIEQR